jgi:hypothetical protein
MREHASSLPVQPAGQPVHLFPYVRNDERTVYRYHGWYRVTLVQALRPYESGEKQKRFPYLNSYGLPCRLIDWSMEPSIQTGVEYFFTLSRMEYHPSLRGFNRMPTGFLATIPWSIRMEVRRQRALDHKKKTKKAT